MKIKKLLTLVLAAAAVFGVSGCKRKSSGTADKTIQYTLSSDPATLDPQIASDASSLTAVQAVFEGLTRLDTDGNAQPGAAKSWESDTDGTRFTFHLRSGIRWDQKKYGAVTADDFVFAFRRALDPTTGSATCLRLFCVKNAAAVHSGSLPASELGVAAEDADTFVVTLEYPCPDFPVIAASAVCMPCCEKFFQSTAGRYGLETDCVLGNGPFCIDGSYGWDHKKKLALDRSDSYLGETAAVPSAIAFTIGSSDSQAAAALLNSTADAAPLPAGTVSSARAAGCTITSFSSSCCGLCFNTQSSLFKNEKARLAFLQAFSRADVLSHLPADTAAAESIFLPGSQAASVEPCYPAQDSAAADTLQAALTELGLKTVPSVTVLCPDDPDVKLMVNDMIAAWNHSFGQYFNMQPLSEDDLKSRVSAGNYTLAVYPLTPSSADPADTLAMFLTSSSTNPAYLSDPAYDALAAAASGKGEAGASAAAAEAERYLCGKSVFYPLYYEKNFYGTAKGVTGILFHPFLSGVDFRGAGKS